RPPDERHLVEGGDEELGQDARRRRGGREVGEEARALPVGDPRKQDLVEVAEHVRERLRPLGRRGGEARADVSRPHLRQHRVAADVLEVARRPLESRLPVFAKAHTSASTSPSEVMTGPVHDSAPAARSSPGTRSWTASMPARTAPGSSSFAPSPTNRHSPGSTPSRAQASSYTRRSGLHSATRQEKTVAPNERAIGVSSHASAVSSEQIVISPSSKPRRRSSATVGSASARRASVRPMSARRMATSSSARSSSTPSSVHTARAAARSGPVERSSEKAFQASTKRSSETPRQRAMRLFVSRAAATSNTASVCHRSKTTAR